MDPLKLVAVDHEDLDVVATHLQDAVVKIGDIHWRPSEKRLVMGLNRFDWECALCGQPHFQRRRTALRFERVNACKCRNMSAQDKDMVLNLLTIEFDQKDAPSGSIMLLSPAERSCGSMSSVWRRSLPTSARYGIRPVVRRTKTT